MRELDDLDRRYGLGALPGTQPDPRAPAPRPRRRRSSGLLPGLLITGLMMGFVVAIAPGDTYSAVRRLVGIGAERLGTAPDVPAGEGEFRFALTQPGSDRPVGYDPCKVLPVEVNPDLAPDGWEEYVDTAIERTAEATGLRLELVGETDDRDFFQRRQRPFAEPPPVLIGWATDEEVEALGGDVAGLGGSTAVEKPNGRRYYTTGSIALDADTFRALGDGGEDEREVAQAIVDHEFGHLVGLAHVDDRRELMFSEGVSTLRYGSGDLEGLARLGNIPCQ